MGGREESWTEVNSPFGSGSSRPGYFYSATEARESMSMKQRTSMKQNAMGNRVLIKSKSDSS